MTVKDVITVSGAATHYTTPGALRGRNQMAIHNEWTGTVAGTLTLWASNHDAPDKADDDDWFEVTDVTLADPAGSASKEGVVVGNANAKWYRQKLVVSSGSGTFTSRVEHVAASTRV